VQIAAGGQWATMIVVTRAVVLAMLVFTIPRAVCAQTLSVLHVKVALADADGKATPVPQHALLITDNPQTVETRRVFTGRDGTVDIKLRPGNYTVESDHPVAFNGRAFEWIQRLDIVAGRDGVLELTDSNARLASVSADSLSGAAVESDPWIILPPRQESVVALWTATTRVSGFVIDAKGLIATSQRAIGAATTAEVQFTPDVKVAATVLVSDSMRDVAILWVDPKAVASIRPIALECGQAAPTVVKGQDIFTIGAPLSQTKGITPGEVTRVDAQRMVSDFRLRSGGLGGPVFIANGSLVGITSLPNQKGDQDQIRLEDPIVVPTSAACDAVVSAETKMASATPPSGTHLPVERASPFPVEALKGVVQGRAGSLNPYQIASSDFDVAFITPVLIYGGQYQAEQMRNRARPSGARTVVTDQGIVRPLMDFRNWSEYVGDFPPVLLIRITPKAAEGFWTTVARGAAQTQGVAIPAIKRPKSAFSRLRAFCGDAEVTPIHPFKLEQQVAETILYEGLYVFDPGALGPQCGTVKLTLYSDKDQEKGDTRVVEPRVIEQIWQDFEPYRAAGL
jgi:S1-C subfamily serine protease